MYETVKRMNDITSQRLDKYLPNVRDAKSHPAKACAVLKNTAFLVRSRSKPSSASIKALLRSLSSRKGDYKRMHEIDQFSIQRIASMKKDGLRAMRHLPNEYFSETEETLSCSKTH